MDTVCFHGDVHDVLQNVASKLDKYVIDKDLHHTDDFIPRVTRFAFLFRARQNS